MYGSDGWLDAKGTSLQHRAESLMQTDTPQGHKVWRGKEALSAFKGSMSLLMCQGPMG